MIRTALEIRCASFLMLVSKFNLESIITPKYLTLLLWFNTVLFNATFKIREALLIWGLMVKTLDLEGFTVSLLVLNQIEIFLDLDLLLCLALMV